MAWRRTGGRTQGAGHRGPDRVAQAAQAAEGRRLELAVRVRAGVRGWAAVLTLVSGALVVGAGAAGAEPQEFTAEGSDSVFGLGARQLAMGGTGTATAFDTYALFYNPANLAVIDRPLLTAGRQLDAELRPLSFMGFAMPLQFARDAGWDASFALGRYPRIHAHSDGAFGPEDFESIFLRFLLPGLKGQYDGTIDSKTLVNRLAFGLSAPGVKGLRFGANIDLIDCRTETCGVDTGDTYSVHATAVSFGVSAAWDVSDRWTLGLAVSDLSQGLTVTTITTAPDGSTTRGQVQSAMPWRLALEAAWQAREDLTLALGAQSYRGRYGDYGLEIDTLHLGAEWQAGGPWVLRAGAWAPLRIWSSQFDAPSLIAPAAPTLGLGWRQGPVTADLAVFAHPVNSMHEGVPVISQEFSLTWRF